MDTYTPMSDLPLTPKSDSYFDTVDPADTHLRQPSVTFADDVKESEPIPPEKEKKVAKKRKSWGQELPIPKTNLPPRKRAKTEDEKEQRRIERVLRNRAAAQSSRERRRVEVEQLEQAQELTKKQNAWLIEQLRVAKEQNERLSQEVAKLSFKLNQSPQSTPKAFTTSPTLAPTLFKQESQESSASLEHIPQEAPYLDQEPAQAAPLAFLTSSTMVEPLATLPDLAQHPAEMLCSDLQCQSGSRWAMTQNTSTNPSMTKIMAVIEYLVIFQFNYLSLITSFNASSTWTTTLLKIFSSLKTGLPMIISHPAEIPVVLTLTHWLISKPNTNFQTSTPRSVFRSQLLRRLLACTPALARPFLDATSAALLLASNDSQISQSSVESQVMDRQQWETLTRMKWVIEQMEKGRGPVDGAGDTSMDESRTDPVLETRRLCRLLDGRHGKKRRVNMGYETANIRSFKDWSSGQ